jgi:hypothetical protein
MEVSGQLHVPAALPPGKVPRYPLDRRLGGPQSRSGRCGEEKNLALHGNRTRIVQPVATPLYGLSHPDSSMAWGKNWKLSPSNFQWVVHKMGYYDHTSTETNRNIGRYWFNAAHAGPKGVNKMPDTKGHVNNITTFSPLVGRGGFRMSSLYFKNRFPCSTMHHMIAMKGLHICIRLYHHLISITIPSMFL